MFRRITDSILGVRLELQAICKALRVLSEASRQSAPPDAVLERLSSLEGSIAALQGTVDAGLVEMDAKRSAARAAEERARGHMKRAEKYVELVKDVEGGAEVDPFEQAGRAYEAQLPAGDDPENNGMLPLLDGMEGRLSGRDMAKAAKRGR